MHLGQRALCDAQLHTTVDDTGWERGTFMFDGWEGDRVEAVHTAYDGA